MAKLEDRLPENAPGDFFVDATCIDCDTCRQIAPSVFDELPRGLSFVKAQPASDADRLRASMALVACPTSSIGSLQKGDTKAAVQSFPEILDEGVMYCGFAAESSFGAQSYFVTRGSGNLLIDSPRAARPLVKRLRELGGARLMLLTHRDDVADHAFYREELGCDRLIHKADQEEETASMERVVEGKDPVRIDDELTVIPVPGHTRGSIALLYKERYLFTGDHLWFSPSQGRLVAARSVCWYSWAEQVRSVERLLDFRFEWVLPGHGRRYRAASAAAMRAEIERALKAMR
jgi:glyoxylase-like metal-dependent hydrolase (beta-lactamase superfamily II)/ferredoxin